MLRTPLPGSALASFRLIQVSVREAFRSPYHTLYYLHMAGTVCKIPFYIFIYMLISIPFQLEP